MFNYVKILNNHQPPFLLHLTFYNKAYTDFGPIFGYCFLLVCCPKLFCGQHDFCCSVERLFLLACVLTLVTINLYTRAANIAGEIENETL